MNKAVWLSSVVCMISLMGGLHPLQFASTNRVRALPGLQMAQAQSQQQESVSPPPQRPTGKDLQPMTTLEVANLSTRIVLAQCLAVESSHVPPPEGNIFTFSNFKVVRALKGAFKEETFTLRLFGGRIGNVEDEAPLMPRFVPGEEVVLFLGADSAEGYPTIFIQGVFRTQRDQQSGTKMVTTPVSGLPLFDAHTGELYAGVPQAIPLGDFLYSLEQLF